MLAAACPPDNGTSGGTQKDPPDSQPPPAVSTTIPTGQATDDDVPPDAGGGLEFDPVSGRLIIPEAGPPAPRPFRPDSKLTTDALTREEQVGLTLQAAFVPRALPKPPQAAEVFQPGIDAAAKATGPLVGITMTAIGRMKLIFESRALPLSYHAELRARFDRYGTLVFWPGSTRYRVAPAGALRTVLGERRVDVTALSPGQKTLSSDGKRLGNPTRDVELVSPLGRVKLELARFPEAGLGGPLLCRALVEMMGIDPASPECLPEEVPLAASFDWVGGGGLDFVVSSLEKRSDLSPGEILVPPPAAERSEDGLPETLDGVLLSQDELKAFRTMAVEAHTNDPAAPPDGLIADNGRDQPMTLYLDGVPVVTVPALDRRYIVGPKQGRYVAQWRTFLGDRVEDPQPVEVPSILRSVPLPTQADAGP